MNLFTKWQQYKEKTKMHLQGPSHHHWIVSEGTWDDPLIYLFILQTLTEARQCIRHRIHKWRHQPPQILRNLSLKHDSVFHWELQNNYKWWGRTKSKEKKPSMITKANSIVHPRETQPLMHMDVRFFNHPMLTLNWTFIFQLWLLAFRGWESDSELILRLIVNSAGPPLITVCS